MDHPRSAVPWSLITGWQLSAMVVVFCLVLPLSICHASRQVSLAWDPNQEDTLKGYRVFHRSTGETYAYDQPSWEGATTTCTISNLDESSDYAFVVRAYDVSDNESADSEEVWLYALSDTGSDSDSDNAAVETYTITASAGAGGQISPAGTIRVDAGGRQGFSITPDSGYHIAAIIVDGKAAASQSTYLFSDVNTNHTIAVTFGADSYTLTALAGEGGSIQPSGQITVTGGADQNFTITADDGYAIADLRVDGESIGSLPHYTIKSIDADHTLKASFIAFNQPPVADAGPDQTVAESEKVTLNGINSDDPDDGIATYHWRQIQGPAVTLSASNQPNVHFVAPDVDAQGVSLVFELTVTDTAGKTSVDTCIVNVTWANLPPTANAGDAQTVSQGDTVTLDGTGSTDPDDGISGYQWQQMEGPEVVLSDIHSASPSFTAPDGTKESASLVFQLTVTDAGGLQDTDRCLVTVEWSGVPPQANAGADQTVSVGDTVTLDGSLSRSGDDDAIVAYRWRQTSGQPVELANATTVSSTFTAPDLGDGGGSLAFELMVTDAAGRLDKDTVKINITAITDEPEEDDEAEPNRPLAMAPANNAQNVPLEPVLQTAEFLSAHSQSQWVIIREADNQVVLDTTSDVYLTELEVAPHVLDADTWYTWKVRFISVRNTETGVVGTFSSWSESSRFKTVKASTDSDEGNAEESADENGGTGSDTEDQDDGAESDPETTPIPTPEQPQPEQPGAMAPVNNTLEVFVTPVLQATDFTSADASDQHLESRWIITRIHDNRCVFDLTSKVYLTELDVPPLVLDANTWYRWTVRFSGTQGTVSEWSQASLFKTGDAGLDADGDGIPDNQAVGGGIDLDGNAIDDAGQANLCCVNVQGGGGQMAICAPENGTVVITAMESTDLASIDGADQLPYEMPLGLVSFRLELAEPGGIVKVSVYFSEPAPQAARWVKYDMVGGWQDYSAHAAFSADRRSVDIEIEDGGFGDLDGVVNGIIIDPSGFGVATGNTTEDDEEAQASIEGTDDSPVPSSSGDNGGGGSCFIGLMWP